MSHKLAHPIYLDVPMMISFLAWVQGGVVTSEEETHEQRTGSEKGLTAGGRFKFPLASLFGIEAGADFKGNRSASDVLQSRVQRHHTDASLFNALYYLLHEEGDVLSISKPEDASNLEPGQLVETTARFKGNPIEEIVSYLGSLLPYVEEQSRVDEAEGQARQRKGKGQRRNDPMDPVKAMTELAEKAAKQQQEFGIRMLRQMASDISDSPVHDLLFETSEGLSSVVTVSSQYYSSETNGSLQAGEFTVFGKVTRVLRNDEEINLTRRTVVSVTGSDGARELISNLTQDGSLHLDIPDPVVTAPAVQILPMAIFV